MSSYEKKLQTTIITGLSGAGKSTALRAFEDIGFYCIDNLPVFLLKDLLHTIREDQDGRDRLALLMDARDTSFLSACKSMFEELNRESFNIEVLFLDAEDDALVRRYSQMRRCHPMAAGGTVRDGIANE